MTFNIKKDRLEREARRLGKSAYKKNSTSNPFEPYSDRYWLWLEGWDEAESEKQAKRSNSARTKISSE